MFKFHPTNIKQEFVPNKFLLNFFQVYIKHFGGLKTKKPLIISGLRVFNFFTLNAQQSINHHTCVGVNVHPRLVSVLEPFQIATGQVHGTPLGGQQI